MATTKIKGRQIADIATGTAVTGGGANRILYLDALQALASDANFTWNGTTLAITGSITVTDDAYGAGWNGSTAVPTKNAVYDKIESLSFSIDIGDAITGGGANRVLYQDGSQNLASSANFTYASGLLSVTGTTEQLRVGYDGSNYVKTTVSSVGEVTFDAVGSAPQFTYLDAIDLSNLTPATSGAPQVLSPYLYLTGRRWNGTADTMSRLRVSVTPRNVGASNYVPSFTVDANAGSSWVNFFYAGAAPDGLTFGAYIKVRNPEVEGWGGALHVTYDGTWAFLKSDDTKSGISPAYVSWSANSSWKNLETFDGGYGTRFNTYFGGDVVFHGNTNQLDTWFKYDDSVHSRWSINSAGTVTLEATGTTPRFDFGKNVRAQNAEIGNWATDSSYAVFAQQSALASAANNYALLQSSDGYTFLNAASTKSIRFRINNGDIATFDASLLLFSTASRFSSTVAIGGGTNDAMFTNAGDTELRIAGTGTMALIRFQENLQIDDAFNIELGTTSGTKIGTATSQKIGFFNATPVTQRTNIGAITDNTGATATNSMDDVDDGGGGIDKDIVNANFATTVDRLNKIEQVLQDLGLTS